MVRDAGWLHRLYWRWRFSTLSRPYYAIKTFLHLHWRAKETAVVLDDCMRAMGQMHYAKGEPGMRTMPNETVSKLVHRGYWEALPNGWKWRKD